MIQHTVAFRLRHPKGSAEETEFFRRARGLRNVPGVMDFRVMRQVGRKNRYTYGLSMRFMSAKTYNDYNGHPDHVAFVNEVWKRDVEDFLEIDYVDIA